MNRCTGSPPVLDDLWEFVNISSGLLLDLEEKAEDLTFRISDKCGADESDGLLLMVLAAKARQYLCGAAGLFRSFRELVRCSNVYPLYEALMYETVCFASSDAFWLITATNFFVASAGLILMTFRAAFFEIEIEGEGGEEDGNTNGPPKTSTSLPTEGIGRSESSEKFQ